MISVYTRALESVFRKSNKKSDAQVVLSRFDPIFQQEESPCSCGHLKMRLTYVGHLVPEL